MQKVALFGLGVMGAGMAANLLKAGFPLTVYNRTRAKADVLGAKGAQVAATPREAADGADALISMVGDDAASRAIWLAEDGALAAAKPDAVLVECSTLSLGWVRELEALAAAHGNSLLDAPVTGSKNEAESGALRLLVGGDAAALERVRPVFEAVSQQIILMGPTGSGAVMKLVNNLMGAVQVASLAEGLALADAAGLDIKQVIALLTNGSVASPIVKLKAERMAGRDFGNASFALRWLHKDTTYALRAADEFAVPLPLTAAARELYRMARNLGYDDDDFSAVIEALHPNNRE